MRELNDIFLEIGVTPKREISEEKLETILLYMKNFDRNLIYGISEDESMVLLLAQFSEGFWLNDWDLNIEEKNFEEKLKKIVSIYFKVSNGRIEVDSYFSREYMNIKREFEVSKMFWFLECYNPKDALKWPFSGDKEKNKMLNDTIKLYVNHLFNEQKILEKSLILIPKWFEEQMLINNNFAKKE